MKQSTTFAQVATNLLNVLQGYTKGIRFLLVMFLTLTVSAEVWGQEELVYTLTPTSGSNNSYTGTCDVEIDGIIWNLAGNSTVQPWRIGGKSLTKVDRALYSKTPISNNISKIIIEHGTASSITVNSVKLFVSTKENGTGTVISELSNSFTPSSTMTFTRPDGKDWTNAYYKIVYNVTVSGNNNKYLHFTNALFYSAGGNTPDPIDPEITFSDGEYTVGGAALDLSTLWSSNSTGDVTYSVTDAGTTGATIEGSTFTATAAGQCTVQASQAATATHNAATATATITVSAPAGDGGDGEYTWELVTDASTLKADDEVIITASGSISNNNYALSTNQKSSNRGGTPITKNGNTLTAPSQDVQILTLKDGSTSGTWAFYTGASGYLYAASSSGNQLKTKTTLDVHGSWTISITDGIASIAAEGSSNRNVMQYNYNNGSPLFACYASASQTSLAIYKKVCTTETSVTLNPNGGKFTSTPDGWTEEGNKLTKEVGGSITLPTPIHDGCYDFAGWYDAQTGGNKIGDEYEPEEDIELFAHWTASIESFVAMIDDENIPTVEGFAVEIGLNEDGTEKVTDGVETTCGNNVYLFRTLVQGYKEVQWTVTIDGTQETITVQNDGEVPYFVMPKADVWVSAELIECDEMDAPVVTATSTNNSITLSWNPITGAKEYNVFIFYDYGNSHQKDDADLVENETSYTFTNLDAEHTYTYIVQAQTEIGTCFTETKGEITTASATCTVTYDANGGEGTITDDNEYTNGETVKVKGNYGKLTKEGYAFTGWNTAADGTGTPYKNGDTFTITGNTTLYAQWCEAHWVLVTNTSEIEDDTRIIIAAKDNNVALSTNQKTNNRGQATITKKYNTVTFAADVQTLSLVGLANNEFALYDAVNNGYLYAASSTANQLKTGGNSNKNGNWDFSISKDGTAYILAQGSNINNQLKYNAGSDLFSCYGEDNSQKDVVIYKEVCVQDQYNVTSTLTKAIAANNNPTTVSATATSLTLNYSANTGYLLPETITVKMGGVELLSGTDYTWNKETGVLTITVTGFYGDIDVKIVAEEDPCYQFAMSEVTATSTTNSITLSWSEVNGATGYNVKIGTGEFTAANGLTHTFEGLSPKTPYTWEVQAVKDGANFHCEASKTGSTTTPKETFTVSWSVNGNVTSTESVVDGEKIKNYPSDPSAAPSGCSTKVFVGWTNQPIPTETDEEPTLYKQLNDVPVITVNTTLHAVWADKTPIPGEDIATTETITCAYLGYNNGDVVETVEGDAFSINWNKGTNSNAPKYYSTGSAIRAYGGNYFTISSKKTITKVVLTFASGEDTNAITTHPGTYSNNTWTGSSNSITFTIGGTSGHRRIATIAVTYTTKGKEIITYSAYTTLCDNCTPSEDLVLEASANTADLDINGKATITFSTTTGGNGGEITYAANPKTGVTWDNGTATFTKAGDYTITASQEKNGEYCPTTSNTVNVTITAIPHLYFVTDPAPTTIEFDPVECGGNTRVEDKKSVSVQAYNLAAAVTAQVTGPYKIARTSGARLNEYYTTLTLDKNEDGHINGNYDDIYILSFPPAGSSEPTEGTLTFKTTNGNTLTVNLSTPTITCTPRTLTFNDRGIKTTQEYYAGTEVPEPATPTGVCGEYEFDGWALAKVERGSTTYEKVTFPFTMPANNQTVLHAVYRYTEGPTNQYELVTEIESGKDYVIAAYDEPNDNFALTNSESSTNGKFTSVRVECDVNNIITTDNANIIWTVTGNDAEGYKFYNSAVKKYIEMYRSDGKSLLRLVDNCTNTFDVNIEMDENDKVYVDITSPEVDENYNVFSFYLELFNVYTRCDYNIYFYEQTATPLYTTTPDCHPSVTLTSDGEVYVTATNGRGIMAATPLTLTTTDLAPNTEIAISSNSSDIYFSTERNTNFAMAQASQPKTSLTLTTNEGGELEKQLYIHYKPSADGDGTPAEVVVTADVSTHNPPFTAQKTIHVRNLPAKFVIATKAGATWYALPANMSGATNPAAVVIEVDETTMTATAPNTIPYTLFPVKTTNGSGDRYTQYGDRVRFSAINYEYRGLWANNNATEQTIRNFAVIDAIGDDGEAAYEWKVATTVVDGNWQYTLQTAQANNQENLCYRMNQENPAWGTYASNEAQYQLYFLPIKAETTPFDYQVVEWYPNKVLIHTTTAFSSLTAKIAGEQVANVKYTAKDANQYEVTGLPLMKNPAKALTLEFVVADATHTGIHTIPVMLSGGNHNISDLSEIGKEIYNYTNLVVRDNATLTIDGSANTDNTFYDVAIYPTAKISVPEGKQLSVHRMTFFGGISEIYNGSTDEPTYELNKYGVPQLSLKGTLGKTVTTMDYIMRVNLDQMYQVGVPYDVNLDEITYWDGSAIELGEELYVSAYDGQARANREKKTWIYETDFETKLGAATLKAGVGYTISAEPQNSDDTYSILRMPMKSNISSGSTEEEKKVNVVAYDNQKGVTITDNHKGWNYLSNPYMTTISGGEADTKLVLGYLKETGTGPWEWVETTQRYVTIPMDNGKDYYQKKFSEAELKPFKSFFVQIATGGELSFALTSRQNAPARLLQQQTTSSEVEFELLLSNGKQSDNTGLLISEEYTPSYEINADLEKMTGAMSVYTIYNGYNLAYNALSPLNAQEQIPVGYIVPAKGEYTFALDPNSDLDAFKHIYLMDYEMGVTTDLIYDAYTFYTADTKSDKRFAIHIELFSDSENKPTGFEDVGLDSEQPYKFMYRGILYIMHNGVIYNTTGQQLNTMDK